MAKWGHDKAGVSGFVERGIRVLLLTAFLMVNVLLALEIHSRLKVIPLLKALEEKTAKLKTN